MHRAGSTTTFPGPPDTNLAKNENRRNRKPPRMVYYSMLGHVLFSPFDKNSTTELEQNLPSTESNCRVWDSTFHFSIC